MRKKREPSELEAAFMAWWDIFAPPDAPPYEREYQFALPAREWIADFAWKTEKLMVELDGGTLSKGRHVRGYGFEGDAFKGNYAVLHGWRVLHYTSNMLHSDPIAVIEQVCRALGVKMAEVQS